MHGGLDVARRSQHARVGILIDSSIIKKTAFSHIMKEALIIIQGKIVNVFR